MTDTSSRTEAPTQQFTRSLSGFGVIILTLSVLSPGVSIFVSSNPILQQAGTGAALAFLIGSFVCFCQTSLIAELSAAYPTAGYDYAAIGHAVGDWAGATSYVNGIFSAPLFLNTSVVGIALYLHPFGLAASDQTLTFLMVGAVTALSLLNIRANEHITGVFMLIETVALLLVTAIGFWHARPDAVRLIVHPVYVHQGLLAAAAIGVVGIAVNNAAWSLAGASQATMFCEDMKNPRSVGRIIMLAFALTVILELAPVLSTVAGAHNLVKVLADNAPFESFLSEYLPSFALKLVSAAIAIAILNACLAGFVGLGRNVFAMARTELFSGPINHALTRLTTRTQAPWVAILFLGATTALATFLPLYVKVLLLSGNYTILTLFYVWGVIAGRRSGRTGGPEHSYASPLFPLMPILGALFVVGEVTVLWLDPDVGRKSLFACSGAWLLAFCYYRFVLMRRPGGWKLRGPADIDAMVRLQDLPESAIREATL
ncbi:MAG TPA: APC family permease [Steroidobacteraceae bacterium]|nr:APC family permease [Steroidobacteraceae bacterium]